MRGRLKNLRKLGTGKTTFFLFKPLTFPHKLCFPIYRTTGHRQRNSTHLQGDASCHCQRWSSATYRLFTGTWDHNSRQESHHLQHSVDVKCPPKLQHPFSHLSHSNKYRAGKRAQTRREGESRKSICTLPFPEPRWGCEEPVSFTRCLWLCWTRPQTAG